MVNINGLGIVKHRLYFHNLESLFKNRGSVKSNGVADTNPLLSNMKKSSKGNVIVFSVVYIFHYSCDIRQIKGSR